MALYRPNLALEAELKADPRVRAAVNVKAQAAGQVARQLAAGFSKSGTYARKFEVEGNRLKNTDPGAWAFELGAPSRNTPARAPLRKAAVAVGAVVVTGGDDG